MIKFKKKKIKELSLNMLASDVTQKINGAGTIHQDRNIGHTRHNNCPSV